MSTVRRVTLLVLASVLAGACTFGDPPTGSIPTLEEAHGMLDRLVGLARAGSFDELCTVSGDGNCERVLEAAGADAVPPRPPTVVATRVVPSVADGEQLTLGGVVLVLCGIDGLGNHYDSEMLVVHGDTGLRAINPIYWGRTRIGDPRNPVTEETFDPVFC